MTASTLPLAESKTSPAPGPLMRPRSVWADTDVPIVLRLPDIHTAPANQPPAAGPPVVDPLALPDARSTQSLPLWLFVMAATFGVVLGLIVLDRWKAYRAASGPKLGPAAVHQPVPTWKVPLSENSTGSHDAGVADGRSQESPGTATAVARQAEGEPARQVTQTGAIGPASNPAGDEPSGSAASGSEPPRSLNPHFGPQREDIVRRPVRPAEPLAGNASQASDVNRPDVPAGEPQTPPAVAPGGGEIPGVTEKTSPRP